MDSAIKFIKAKKTGVVITMLIVLVSIGSVAAFTYGPYASIEAENGSLSGGTSLVADGNASGGSAIRFSSPSGITAGANLPITYSLGTLPGTARFVATDGSDVTGDGSIGAPYATLGAAYTASSTGDSIVVRGGEYRGVSEQFNSKELTIKAYPGETPVFNGAEVVSGGWISESSLEYISYTPRPVTDASGISFSTGQNLNGDGVGKFPDQVWIGTDKLQQVNQKGDIVDGTFWVDQVNDRLYLTATDAARPDIEVSNTGRFMRIFSPNTTIEGLSLIRYATTGTDYGVVLAENTADGLTLRNIEIIDPSFHSIVLGGSAGSSLIENILIEDSTISGSNWMGITALYVTNLTVNRTLLSDMDPFDEFSSSPQSGAIKTSRADNTIVTNSIIRDNNSHGLWFDQSNRDTTIANSDFSNNQRTSIFYEISDGLLMVNNRVVASSSDQQPVKLAGSSKLVLVNNTIIGGKDPIGIYTDSRSAPNCADPAGPICTGGISSDKDYVRPYYTEMDWMPRLDMMINNIVAYPESVGLCSINVPLCFLTTNSGASQPIEEILHGVDVGRGIPETIMDANVYAHGANPIIRVTSPAVNYSNISAFASAMDNAPVSLPNIENNGLSGDSYVNPDGTPTSALQALVSQAYAIPTDADINTYVPAGTRHFGVTWD